MTDRGLVLLFGALLLLGCNRGIQTPEAVRQGVIDHLSRRADLDVNSMQVDVTSVSFRQNEADATVSFRPKGAGAGAGMQMRYLLERRGNRWVVKSKSEAGGSPHGASPAPGTRALELPPGHPPAGGSQGEKGAGVREKGASSDSKDSGSGKKQ